MKTEIKTLTFIAIAVLMTTTTMSIAVHQQMVEAAGQSNNQHSHGNIDSSGKDGSSGNLHTNFNVVSNSGGKDGGHNHFGETCNSNNNKCNSHGNND
jgi:hypothetical protein